MKVGFFHNMNNNFFALTRYLRDRGEDALLLRFQHEKKQFRPDWDAVSDEDLQCVRELSWDRVDQLLGNSPASLNAVLEEFDTIVGCGNAPAYFCRAGRPADLLLPYGGDISELPYRRKFNPLKPYRSLCMRKLADYQRKGIQEAKAIITEMGFHGEFIDRLGYQGLVIDHHMPIVYDYTDQILENREIKESPFAQKIREIRDSSEFIVFHHARHIWKTEIDEISWKRNNIMIGGFAKFLQATKSKSAKLILFEYGPDVDASKSLIAELGIDDHVVWMPLSPRKYILYGILHSDVGSGQFGLPVNLNGVTQEALACGKPVIHHRMDSRHSAETLASLYPVCDAETVDEVATALERLYSEPLQGREMGEACRTWYKDVFVERFFRHFRTATGQDSAATAVSAKAV